MGSCTVFLVEDDDRMRTHLAKAIEAHLELELVGAASSCAEARDLLSRVTPDVFLTDIGLPDGSGVDLIRTVRKAMPKTQIMVVTIFGDERTVVASLEAGASGYLLKDYTSEQIANSIQQLIAGGAPISAPIARYLLNRFRESAAEETAPELGIRPSLTPRESEVLAFIAKGFSFGEIAGFLSISSHTVTTHVRHIYDKLEVSSRGAAVYEAVNRGIIKMQ